MKNVILLLGLSVLLLITNQSCQPKQKKYNQINGSWETIDGVTHELYTFNNGTYTKKGVYDSVTLDIEGLYFINENEKRHSVTLTLVPNEFIPIEKEYHTLMPCENLDLISINHDKMILVKSNFIDGNLRNNYQSIDDTLFRVDE